MKSDFQLFGGFSLFLFYFRWSSVVLCCVKRANLRLWKNLLSWVFWAEIALGSWKGYVIDERGSYACARVIQFTVWVASKNESNYLLQNTMVSTSIWRHVILLYVVRSNILWLTIKLSYHYWCNIASYVNRKFALNFLLYIATKKS